MVKKAKEGPVVPAGLLGQSFSEAMADHLGLEWHMGIKQGERKRETAKLRKHF